MQTRDHKKLAEMFATEMSRKRIPYICKESIYLWEYRTR